MKKIRVLILLLVILLIPCCIFVACNDNTEDCSEGHTWRHENNPKRHELIQSRTCLLPEIREKECKVCGATEQYVAQEPRGHQYDTSKKIYLNDATCTENGHTVNHCFWYDICGHEADLIEEVEGSAKGHTFLNYEPTEEDPTIGIAKCIDCDATDKRLLGVTLDMEGDRSHLSYQNGLKIYTANLTNAAEYKVNGNNTYLYIARPASGYLGGAEFGVAISSHASATKSTFVMEFELILDENKSGDIAVIGKKAVLSQQMTFLTYNSASKTLESADGPLYSLVNGGVFVGTVKIAIAVNNPGQYYQVYVNGARVSENVAFVGSFFAGFDLASVDVVMAGTGASEFGIDNIKLYSGIEPDGYDLNNVQIGYESKEIYRSEDGTDVQRISIKKSAQGCDCASHYVEKLSVSRTCTTAGYKLDECTECGGQRVRQPMAPTYHKNKWVLVETVAPTCLEYGYYIYECSACHAVNGEVIPGDEGKPLGHAHGADATVIDRTCISAEITKGNCVRCNTYFEEETALPYTHELGEDATVVPPTCSEDGYTIGTCIHCGIEYKDPKTKVEKFDCYYLEYDVHVDPTCTTGGYDEFKCLSCGKTKQENEVNATGHKTYVNVNGNSITYHCVHCDYSFSYVAAGGADGTMPPFGEMSTTLGGVDNIIDRAYAVGDQDGKKMTESGDVNDINSNYFAWSNMTDGTRNSFARLTFAPDKNDRHGYRDFTYRNDSDAYCIDGKSVVFEIEVKWPTQAELDANGYVKGGISIGFRSMTDNAVCVDYATGTIYANDLSVTNTYSNAISNGTAIGTISADKWTKIAIVLNPIDRVYKIYINGEQKATSEWPAKSGNLWYGGTNCMRITCLRFRNPAGVGAIDVRNLYVYKSDFPVYMGRPYIAQDEIAADFQNTELGAALGNKLNVTADEGYQLSIYEKKLNVKYAPATETTDSYISADFGSYKNKKFTISTKVKFNADTGDYDIIKLENSDGKAVSLISIKDKKLNVYGIKWTKAIEATNEFTVDVIVNGADKTFEAFIGGVMVAEGVSFADSEYGKSEAEGCTVKMFNVNDGSAAIDVAVSSIEGFGDGVIPDYYAGKLATHTLGGYRDTLVSFDGTEDINDILPFNAKRPNGYYYELLGDSALSIKLCPVDEKIIGNLRYTTISGDKIIGAEEHRTLYNVLATGDFGTYGVMDISFDSFTSLEVDLANGFKIDAYDKIITKFYVENTVNYQFKITATVSNGSTSKQVELANGIDSVDEDENPIKLPYSTGWYTVIVELPDDAKYLYGIEVEFIGVDGNKELDGFSFYLKSIEIEADDTVIDETEFVYYPLVADKCEHKFGEKNVVAATCTENGYTTRVCSKCGYMSFEQTDRLGHKFVENGEAELPEGFVRDNTCESGACTLYTCETCGKNTLEFIPAERHNFVKLENATEEDGYKKATCLNTGIDVYVCANESCEHKDKKFLFVTDALGHAPAEDTEYIVESEVSCLTNGVTIVTKCANCGGAYSVVTEAHGHDYEKITEKPTCTESGRYYEKCKSCGDVRYSEEIAPAGHKAPAIYLHTRVEATCINAEGWKYTCTECGEYGYIADPGKAPIDHVWGDWAEVTPMTCANEGFRDKTCSGCGGKFSELGSGEGCIIPITADHAWANKTDDFGKWSECTTCHQTKDFKGFTFTYNNKGAYVLTGYNGDAVDVAVPNTYNGKPVIIGSAFAGNTAIESVTIADGVLIDAGAFAGCTSLKSIKLPSDLAYIPDDAFKGCTALTEIELPASCTEIRTGAFADCSGLTKIVIKGELTAVQKFAFANCDSLESVVYVSAILPKIEELGNGAFIGAEWTVA